MSLSVESEVAWVALNALRSGASASRARTDRESRGGAARERGGAALCAADSYDLCMSVHPEGESLRRAVRWISGHLSEDAEQALPPLVDSATLRFDLTPREAEYLYGFYRNAKIEPNDEPAS